MLIYFKEFIKLTDLIFANLFHNIEQDSAHPLSWFKVNAIGIILQVGRSEVDPEMGGGRLPLPGKLHRCFTGGAGNPAERVYFAGPGGIETNDVYLVVIASRLGRRCKPGIPTEVGRAGEGIKQEARFGGQLKAARCNLNLAEIDGEVGVVARDGSSSPPPAAGTRKRSRRTRYGWQV